MQKKVLDILCVSCNDGSAINGNHHSPPFNGHNERGFKMRHGGEYKTFTGWKKSIRSSFPNCFIDGDHEIACAPGIGEWDGETGVTYNFPRAKAISLNGMARQGIKTTETMKAARQVKGRRDHERRIKDHAAKVAQRKTEDNELRSAMEVYCVDHFGQIPIDAGVTIMKFEEKFGMEALRDIAGFINWSEHNDKDIDWVRGNIAHDLGGVFEGPGFSPRTKGYHEIYANLPETNATDLTPEEQAIIDTENIPSDRIEIDASKTVAKRLTSTSWWNAVGMVQNYERARHINDEHMIKMFENSYPNMTKADFDKLAAGDYTIDTDGSALSNTVIVISEVN